MKKTNYTVLNNISKINETAMLIFKASSITTTATAILSLLSFAFFGDELTAELLFGGACRIMVLGVSFSTAIDILSKRKG